MTTAQEITALLESMRDERQAATLMRFSKQEKENMAKVTVSSG